MTTDIPDSETESRNTVQTILVELGRFVRPLKIATDGFEAGTVEPLLTLLDDMGLDEEVIGEDLDPIVAQLEDAGEAIGVLDEAVITPLEAGESPEITRVDDVLDAGKTVFETVTGLSDLEVDLDDLDAEDIGECFAEYLIITYLHNDHAQAYDLLCIFGLIDESVDPTDLDLSALGTAFTEPTKLPSEVFGWATADFRANELLAYMGEFLTKRGYPVGHDEGSPFDFTPDPGVLPGTTGSPPPVVPTSAGLRIPIVTQPVSFGLEVNELSPEQQKLAGLAIRPYGNVNFNETTKLGEDWRLTTKVSAETTDEWGVGIRPDEETFRPLPTLLPESGSPGIDVVAKGLLEYLPATSGEESVLLGDPEATRLVLQSLSMGAIAEGSTTDFEFRGELPLSLLLSVEPEGGFVENFVPEGINSEFDLTLGWSSKTGVYFQSSGSMEAAIQIQKALGPVTLKEVFVSLGIESAPPAFPITIAASAEGSLGPLRVTVKRMGLEARCSFPEDGSGNAGPIDFDIGFKPPEGVGISVEAGPVSGGGYIEHEPDKHRYAGTLQLEIGDWTIDAVGLLKTKLPGGADGYSFLLLITAELPPIQLGFGFTLNGIGGLLGVNRGMNKDPLGEAVRTGNLDSVLFPENVVANAQRIISDLRAIFPPKADRHVVGPMARFGWGTPTLLTMDVGVVLGIPTWKIAILGKLSLVLPDEEAAIVDLNLAVLGFLDIPNKRLEITASLYDSRIAMFAAKGDMALKSSWGETASFLLSIGGFHPRYDPPKSFPDLDRVQAWIPGLDDNVRVRMAGYLAVTPNTFQVGTNTLVHATAGPAKVHGEWGWDALFQFDPFKFVVDFYAKFAASLWGHSLSIKIDGTLQGPQPLRIRGKVSIDLPLLPEVKTSLDVSIGSSPDGEALPESKVFDKLVDEVETPQNWQAQVPAGGASFVTIRQPRDETESTGQAGGGSEHVLTHPLGGIAVRQTVVPFEYRIEKFGNARPAGFDKFRVTGVVTVEQVTTAGGDTREETTTVGPTPGEGLYEKFAPAKYRKMSDTDKLSSKSFVDRLAGHRSGDEQFHEPAEANCTTASLEYETLITDERERRFAKPLTELGRYRLAHPAVARVGLPPETASAFLPLSAVGRAQPTTTGFILDKPERVGLPDLTVDEDDEEELGVAVSGVLR